MPEPQPLAVGDDAMLRLIAAYLHAGMQPTYRQLAERAGMSLGNVARTIGRLEEKGWLQRTGGETRARRIELLRWPEGFNPYPAIRGDDQ